MFMKILRRKKVFRHRLVFTSKWKDSLRLFLNFGLFFSSLTN
ncbi:hypothetical protein LEP1GSC068_3758 [Leptospira sp. Fiocruz LV3954]|nr:hypothetical protein LEP1GSC068_3758 [Leptospira sp. Fiocruz LV3954]EMI68527.1 hypothetical protein LEP1GSC076_0592 [Leptospira sp. Fiocruz LV4135]